MSRVDGLKTKVSEFKRFTSTVDSFIENNKPFINKHDVRMTGNSVIISSYDYDKTKQIIKYMRRSTGHQFKFKHSFYCDSMIFVWESGFFQIWFNCDPENVPAELMPSKDCTVEKQIRPEQVDYRIVCKVGK